MICFRWVYFIFDAPKVTKATIVKLMTLPLLMSIWNLGLIQFFWGCSGVIKLDSNTKLKLSSYVFYYMPN